MTSAEAFVAQAAGKNAASGRKPSELFDTVDQFSGPSFSRQRQQQTLLEPPRHIVPSHGNLKGPGPMPAQASSSYRPDIDNFAQDTSEQRSPTRATPRQARRVSSQGAQRRVTEARRSGAHSRTQSMEERRRERESTLCLVVGQNKNSLRGTRCVRFYKNNHCLWAVVPDAFRQRSGFQAIKAHRSMFNTVIKLGDDYAFTITSETWVIWLYGNNEDRGVEQKIFSVIVAPPDSPYTKPQVGHLSEIYSGFLNAKRPLDDRGHPTGTIPGPSPTFSYPQHTLQTSLALEVGAAATNQSIQNPCFWDGASAIVPGNPVPSVAPEAGIMLTSYPGLEPPPDQDYGQQSYHYYGANFGLHGFGSGST